MGQAQRYTRLAVAIVCSTARTAFAGGVVLTRPARSGVPSPLGYERAWDRGCQDRGASVSITGQPSHGTLGVERGTSIIPASTPRFGSTGRCRGRPITGEQVMYSPITRAATAA